MRFAPAGLRPSALAPRNLVSVRQGIKSMAPSPRWRRRLAILCGALAVLGTAYMLWLRDSTLVAVEDVTVTGPTGPDAERLRAALDDAARDMTTLHIDRAALVAAAEPFPVVQAIEVEAEFPHGLKVIVTEHRPVAVLVAGSERLPVAADGSVLEGLPTGGPLPEVKAQGPVPDAQLGPGPALDAVRVAGGAPGMLVGRLGEVRRDQDRGLVASVDEGPELIFGTTARLAAKWAAATRVLADPDAAGAEYIDVRLPERPAAGGLAVETVAPVAPVGDAATEIPEVPIDPITGAPIAPVEPATPVPEAAPAPEPTAPEPAPADEAPEQAVDPGGGALAEPQP